MNLIINRILFFGMILLIYSCENNKIYTKEYYLDSGNLKFEGYFENGMPVDTLKSYFNNGTLESIEVYNDSGRLDGLNKYFHNNGKLHQEIHYSNGLKNGWYRSYDSNGIINKKVFLSEDQQIGNTYFFNQNGSLKEFNFLDFESKLIFVNFYDSNGIFINSIGQDDIFFIDTFKILNNHEIPAFEFKILVSQIPGYFIQLNLNLKNESGKIIYTDSIKESTPMITLINSISIHELHEIEIIGAKYDSLTNEKLRTLIIRRELW